MFEKEKVEESFKRRWFTRANDASYAAYSMSRKYGGEFCKRIRANIQRAKDEFRGYSKEAIETDQNLKIKMDQCLSILEEDVAEAKRNLEAASKVAREDWKQSGHSRRRSPA